MAWATREKVVVNPPRKRFGRKSKASRANRRHRSRRNTGEIVSWVLNPGSARGKGKMATTRRKRKRYGSASHRSRSNPRRRRVAARSNSHRRRRSVRMNPRRRYGRRNPGGVSVTELFMEGIFATAGAVGSKLLTQAVLGSNNTGIMGYLGNAASGLALGLAAGATSATRKYAKDIYIGTVVGIVIRVISDYTSYGSQLALSGIGDYQVQNFVTPQRLVDGLHSSQIQIPSGWGAAPVVISSAAVPASHGGASAGGMGSAYDGGSGYDVM